MDLPRDAVLQRIASANPRIVAVVAGPGWGKSFLGGEILEKSASGVSCAFGGIRDLADADARLERAFGSGGWSNGDVDVAVLDDVHELSAAGGDGRLETLLRTLPVNRRLVLLSRHPLSVDIFRHAAPHEILTLRGGDIEFTREECRRAFAFEDMPRATRERALDLADGWPIATLLMSRLAREGRLAASLEDLACSAFGDLHAYIQRNLLTRLNAAELAIVTACAAIPNASSDDVCAALGEDAAATLRSLAVRQHFRTEGDAYLLHPLIETSIRLFQPEKLEALIRSAAAAYTAAGQHLRAARMSLLTGDDAGACAALDRSGPHAAGESMSAAYYEIANALPLKDVLGSTYVFADFFGSRIVRSRPYELYERVRQYCESLSPDVAPVVRYSARIALFITLRGSLKLREAEVVARECIALAETFPDWPDRRLLLMGEFACLQAQLGKVERAAHIWRQLYGEAPPERMYSALQSIVLAFTTTIYSGDRAAVNALLDRNIAVSRRWNDGPSLIFSLGARAVADAIFDPDVSLTHALNALGADPARSRFFYHAKRVLEVEDEYPTITGGFLTIEAALGQTDAEIATRLLDNAVAGFDRIGQPYWKIVGRIARAAVPDSDSAAMRRECLAFAAEIEVPAIVAQVSALVDGRETPGPLSGILARVRTSALAKGAARLRINVMTASVTRGSEEIPIRQREFEVAAVLALAGTRVSVDQLCERVWPAADPDAAVSALRMSVHRLRKQLGSNDAVQSVSAGYLLSPEIGLDIADAEGMVFAARRLNAMSESDYARMRSLFVQLTTSRNVLERYAWHGTIEERIQAVRHAAGTLIARYDLARGNAVLALETAETLLRFDPLDEPAVELTVRALLAAGDRSEASRRWRLYTTKLESEYAAEPSITLEDIISDRPLAV